MAKILVVDDDPTTLKMIETVLKVKGHKVFCCSNAKVGLSTLLKVEPDLAIIDYMMPARDGIYLLKDIRSVQEFKLLPVIILTGSRDPEVVNKAIKLGVNDFVVKPIKILNLLERLDKILLNL